MRLEGILAHLSLPIEEEQTPITEHLLRQTLADVDTDPDTLIEAELRRELDE